MLSRGGGFYSFGIERQRRTPNSSFVKGGGLRRWCIEAGTGRRYRDIYQFWIAFVGIRGSSRSDGQPLTTPGPLTERL